jgi:hypothetical protein
MNRLIEVFFRGDILLMKPDLRCQLMQPYYDQKLTEIIFRSKLIKRFFKHEIYNFKMKTHFSQKFLCYRKGYSKFIKSKFRSSFIKDCLKSMRRHVKNNMNEVLLGFHKMNTVLLNFNVERDDLKLSEIVDAINSFNRHSPLIKKYIKELYSKAAKYLLETTNSLFDNHIMNYSNLMFKIFKRKFKSNLNSKLNSTI